MAMPHLAQDWVVNCRGHSQAQEEAGATVHRGRKVSASLFSFWRSLQGRAVPAAQAAEREGGSEPGLVQRTPGVEVREQISRLGVGGGAYGISGQARRGRERWVGGGGDPHQVGRSCGSC